MESFNAIYACQNRSFRCCVDIILEIKLCRMYWSNQRRIEISRLGQISLLVGLNLAVYGPKCAGNACFAELGGNYGNFPRDDRPHRTVPCILLPSTPHPSRVASCPTILLVGTTTMQGSINNIISLAKSENGWHSYGLW